MKNVGGIVRKLKKQVFVQKVGKQHSEKRRDGDRCTMRHNYGIIHGYCRKSGKM